MTLTQLKYVITIADTGSMNEAAKLLFISQPSLSLALKELEHEIGTELFKRSNRGVVRPRKDRSSWAMPGRSRNSIS